MGYCYTKFVTGVLMKEKIASFFKSTSARLLFFVVIVVLALIIGRGTCTPRNGIVLADYSVERDYKQVVDLFRRNLYWLDANPNPPIERIFTYLSSRGNPDNKNSLTVKVLRSGSDLVGFVSYYMKSPVLGFVLYLAVDEQFRGRRFSDRLMKQAIDDLVSRGAQHIKLITRPTNISAQMVYERLGFRELGRNSVYVYYEYRP